MKKTLYTLAFVALFSIITKAQTPAQPTPVEEPKKETVNPDGTAVPVTPSRVDEPIAPAEATPATEKKARPTSRTTPVPAPAQNTATPAPRKDRHAITEKGVPSSRAKTTPTPAPKAAEQKKTPATKQ